MPGRLLQSESVAPWLSKITFEDDMSRKFVGEITFLKDDYGFLLDNEQNSRFFHRSYVKDPSYDDLEIGDSVDRTRVIGAASVAWN